MKEADLKSAVQHALDIAKALGASDAEVAASFGEGFSITVRNGEMDESEHQADVGLGITIYRGHQQGVATTGDLSAKAIADTVAAANDIARYTEADACFGLPAKADLAVSWPELSLHHPWRIAPKQAAELAKECEAIALAQDKRICTSEGVSLSSYSSCKVFGNSLGFLNAFYSSRHSLSCSLIAESKGQKERDYDYTVARHPEDLLSLQTIAQQAAKKTVERLDSRPIGSCQVPVLFQASVAAGFFAQILSAVTGSRIYHRSSYLVDSLGQQLFPDFMRLFENPFVPRGLASCPYDAEAVKVQPKALVEAGVLQSYLLDTYSARKLGLSTTGHAGGFHNIFVSNSGHSFEDLLKTLDNGLLVTEVMGQGVNLVTGDYSRGCAGFWVENGKIQAPVNEITIAGNLRDMCQQIVAVGTDTENRGRIQTGSILIESMMVGGQSS